MAADPGRAAYEARFAHARPRDVEPWDSLTPEVKGIWARVEAACVAPLKAELDEAREEADLVREDSGEQMRMLDAIASKLGLAHDEGLEDPGPFLAAIDRLRIAFHDAIRRPLGVTPDSGAEFYDQRLADEAEARRSSASAESENPAKSASGRLVQSEVAARAAALADARSRERQEAGR